MNVEQQEFICKQGARLLVEAGADSLYLFPGMGTYTVEGARYVYECRRRVKPRADTAPALAYDNYTVAEDRFIDQHGFSSNLT